jgi:hypothetical protein
VEQSSSGIDSIFRYESGSRSYDLDSAHAIPPVGVLPCRTAMNRVHFIFQGGDQRKYAGGIDALRLRRTGFLKAISPEPTEGRPGRLRIIDGRACSIRFFPRCGLIVSALVQHQSGDFSLGVTGEFDHRVHRLDQELRFR